MQATDLTLFESTFLLGVTPEGKKSSYLSFALGGALLADLALLERIELVTERKKTFVESRSTASTGMPVLDEVGELIATSKRRKRTEGWITKISGRKGLDRACAARLIATGILQVHDTRVAVLFPSTRFPEVQPGPETHLRFAIDQAVNGAYADRRTAILTGIAYRSMLIKPEGDRAAKKAIRQRVDDLTSGDPLAKAVKGAIDAQMAALGAA